MKIAVTADLHWGVGRAGDRTTRALRDYLLAQPPDVFIVAGDVGEGGAFAGCLDRFRELPGVRLLIPGNHDLWLRDPSQSSLAVYQRRLPSIASQRGFQVLDHAPWISEDGKLAIVGSMNWYDYSFADPALLSEYPSASEMYERKLFPNARHNDGQYVHLGMSDAEFTGRLVGAFRGQLEALPATVERIIAVQHHPPVRELFYPSALTTVDQRFWLAYTGNRTMEAAVLEDARVSHVFCGHTHATVDAVVQGKRCRNVGGDYHWKRLVWLDTETSEEGAEEFR